MSVASDGSAARLVPESVAVCPVCGKGVRIEGIEVMGRESDDAPWLPVGVALSCDYEPDLNPEEESQWYQQHYAIPFVDWLWIEAVVVSWLRQSEQQDLVGRIRGFDVYGSPS